MNRLSLKTTSLLIAVFLLLFNPAKAQVKNELDDTDQLSLLERSIPLKINLQQTAEQITAIKAQAIKAQNDIIHARCLYDLMQIRDLRTDDTLYFRNSAFMDTLLAGRTASAGLKTILYLMRAKRINLFNNQYQQRRITAYRTPNLPTDYASLNAAQRDSVVIHDFAAALKYEGTPIDAGQLLWLPSNRNLFLFAPRFPDLVLSERVNQLFLKKRANYNTPDNMAAWLGLPSASFRQKLDSVARNYPQLNEVMAAYQQWLAFNQASAEKSVYIETLIRKEIYSSHMTDSVARSNYITFLQNLVAAPYTYAKAFAVYQLCIIYNREGGQYASFGKRYYGEQPSIQTQYQYAPQKALQLFEQNKALLSGYVFYSQLDEMARQIRASGIAVEMSDHHLPGAAIPIKAIYKNVDTLFYRIIRINAKDSMQAGKMVTSNVQMNASTASAGKFILPLPADHNQHAIYLKLEPLPVGRYGLLFNNQVIGAGQTVNAIHFTVTNIAAVNSEERIFVLNRKTGLPISGAVISAYHKKVPVTAKVPMQTNKSGYLTIPDGLADSITIANQGDTTGYKFTIDRHNSSDEIYDKEEFDDMAEFHKEKVKVEIFTDRAIYRPGQPVHYKLIFLTNNPYTGVTMLFTRKNVGSKTFDQIFKQWLNDKDDVITLVGPFSKKIDSVRFMPNEFGSFAGTFQLPKSAATGGWSIDSELDLGQNRGLFEVEEYNRPTIELTMEKPKKLLLPGDPFNIKLKLRSFSGASLNKTPVTYTISRSGDLPDGYASKVRYSYAEIISNKGFTDENGELSIHVTDTAVAHIKLDEQRSWTFQYSLKATAVDPSGETADLNDHVAVSTRPVYIRLPVNPSYDRRFAPLINVSITTFAGDTATRWVNFKLYKVTNPNELSAGQIHAVDQWYYTRSDWNSWFPAQAEGIKVTGERALLLDTMIRITDHKKLILPKQLLQTGFYQLTADCRNDGQIIGENKAQFMVFDSATGESPTELIYTPSYDAAKPGDLISGYNSDSNRGFAIYHVLYANNKNTVKSEYYTVPDGGNTWVYRIPVDAFGNLTINRINVRNNEIITQQKRINLAMMIGIQPDIIVEKYRKVMAPGAKETFTLSIKTKNDNVAAELMTTLYDASLDKLEKHDWQWYLGQRRNRYLYSNWTSALAETRQASSSDYSFSPVSIPDLSTAFNGDMYSLLQGKVAGVNIRNYTTGAISTVTIRGAATNLTDFAQPLVVLDGEVFTGSLKEISMASITQGIVLKGADASDIYGSRGAQGVLILSTKGPIILPQPPEPKIKIRKDFNETAFFFPQIHADKDGYYSFSFTMPESATEWNWKVLAQTRKAQFIYLEKKLQTQLRLMVEPNMPRLLYQGDKIKLQSRVSNLDTLAVDGKVICKIEDAVTGQDLTASFTGVSNQTFHLTKKSTRAVAFWLQVPAGQLNPIKIVISATGGGLADAEEHTIPVLSPKILIRQSERILFGDQTTLNIPAVNLPADAVIYGLGIAINQKPQATLINALPWLANYSYDCAEQTFNKLRAEVAALKLMLTDTIAQNLYKTAIASAEKEGAKDETLPDELAAEAMPWLQINSNAAQQQKQLIALLNFSETQGKVYKHIERLTKLQNVDGGLAWFDGGKSNAYISAYVLAGFGQLKAQGWKADVKTTELISRLVKYNQEIFAAAKPDQEALYQLYALSYWVVDYPLPAPVVQKVSTRLAAEWLHVQGFSLAEQSILIINTVRYHAANALYQQAQQQLASIRQLGIEDAGHGLRWKDITTTDPMDYSDEETMALLAEAFELNEKHKEVRAGIVKWLLTAKQDQHWQSTKATASAIDLLQKEKGSALGATKAFSAEAGGQQLTVSDGLLSGSPSAFARLNKLPAGIRLAQQGTSTSGALTWYYFADPATVDLSNKGVSIKKQFYSYSKEKGWIAFTPQTQLRAGDEVQVRLTITAATRLTFVHINDPRAAAFEPKEHGSGYQYGPGFSYYQSIRDTGLDLFTEDLPKGVSELTYQLVVAHEGEFVSGPAHLQAMYQPLTTAYSKVERVKVVE